jgi:trehalose 6-phosphate phosphatase
VKDLLAPAQEPVLRQLASWNVLLALDYDGTLAPIVAEPDKARMRVRTRDLLEEAARAYPCVVISGRSQEDVLKRVRGAGVFEVIGNHGLEPWRRTEGFAAQVQLWVPALRERLASMEGVVIENKSFSIAIHYRRAPSRTQARAAIRSVATQLDGVRIVGGKCIINLIPRGAPHKGVALGLARDHLRCDVALYIGDDETDEDVFGLHDAGRLLGVRVGASVSSRAAFFIKNQNAIDALLGRLVAFRQERGFAS